MTSIRLTLSLSLLLTGWNLSVADDANRARNDAIIVRAIERMPDYDYSNDQHVQDAIKRHLDRVLGTEEYP